MEKLISVIMSTYNESETELKEAIESILNQSYENFEFIIIQDNPENYKAKHLLEAYQNKDMRIKLYFNKENLGLAASLNKGIEKSKGDYIARMDADDLSYDNRFEIQINFLENNKEIDFVSSSIDIFDGEKIIYKRMAKKYPQKEDLLFGPCFIHPAIIFRAESIKKAGGYKIEKYTRRTEDYDLFMRMYAMGMKGYNFEKSLLRYTESDVTIRKRKYRYRIDEAIIRYKGFKTLDLFPKGYLYVLKPLFIGLIPNFVAKKIKQHISRTSQGNKYEFYKK